MRKALARLILPFLVFEDILVFVRGGDSYLGRRIEMEIENAAHQRGLQEGGRGVVWDDGRHRVGSPDLHQRLERLADLSEGQAKDSRELNQLKIDANSLACALRRLLAAVDDMMNIDTAGKGLPQKARLTQAMRLAREALERLSQ